MNSEGYSIQYTCVTRKGASYFIVNGAHSKKRAELSKIFYSEIKKKLNEIISSHK